MALADPQPPDWRVRGAGARFTPRDDNHDLQRALARFRAKCRFDARTGCVLWTGGTTRGRGNTATYGSFWYDGRRWFAHRWAAAFIHNLDLDGLQVGHCCPHGPNTLCVHHVTGQTQADNLAELNDRLRARRLADQTNEQRLFWLLVERGYEQLPPEPAPEPCDIPFYQPPAWLGQRQAPAHATDCPF